MKIRGIICMICNLVMVAAILGGFVLSIWSLFVLFDHPGEMQGDSSIPTEVRADYQRLSDIEWQWTLRISGSFMVALIVGLIAYQEPPGSRTLNWAHREELRRASDEYGVPEDSIQTELMAEIEARRGSGISVYLQRENGKNLESPSAQ